MVELEFGKCPTARVFQRKGLRPKLPKSFGHVELGLSRASWVSLLRLDGAPSLHVTESGVCSYTPVSSSPVRAVVSAPPQPHGEHPIHARNSAHPPCLRNSRISFRPEDFPVTVNICVCKATLCPVYSCSSRI